MPLTMPAKAAIARAAGPETRAKAEGDAERLVVVARTKTVTNRMQDAAVAELGGHGGLTGRALPMVEIAGCARHAVAVL